jgi:predicted ribosome quality control (RQC) complex YloA/Tae2 family protein
MKTQEIFIPSLNEIITYFIGSNAEDNWKIIDKSKLDDIWFHLSDYPSCHVIANLSKKYNKKDQKYIIKQGAILCKQNSKFKSEKNIKIVYTNIKNIKKTDIVGSVNILKSSTLLI